MTNLPDLLRTLHRILKQKTDLESRMARGPKVVAANTALVKNCEDQLSAAKELSLKTRMAADEKQVQLKQREQRVERLKGQLDAAANNKEFQTLKEQIAADEQANSVLADEILELLEAYDTRGEEVKEAEAKLATAQRELAATQSRIDADRAMLEGELARVLEELAKTEADIPGDLLDTYRRQVKAKGENCLAEVDGNICGNCYQTLSPQVLNSLMLNRTVPCGGCGSFLYLAER
ncbi:MAG: phospholipase [Pirellulaceae bacterium]|nr:hypothetical protein [Planctomycetales bacterium]